MSSNAPKQIKPIYYPESDGQPMAETPEHIELMIDLRFALRNHFHDAPNVYLGVNMFLYYVEGNPKKCVAPDLFVVCDAPPAPPRRTWKTWEEDRVPDVVIELSSRKTFEEDLQKKWRTYAEMGVAEYYIFDPFYDFLDRPLLAYRLEGNEFVSVEVVDGVVMSEALGLELVDTGETLRLRHPATGQFLLTETEAVARAEQEAKRAEQEAKRAEQEAKRAENATKRARKEASARTAAETRLALMAAKLRELGVNPDQL